MKKVICLILVVLISCSLCSCVSNEQEQTKQILEHEKNVHISIWTDEETGVQYVIWRDSYKGGITPRLNADGTVYHPTEKGGEQE